ncbi:MAG TPA: mechanosensitive ion channel family protein [Elusimicrobiota bacterium]|nr:mechanosensitive ion channel family protein [Elusimicrobiota bacterium]
MSRSASVLAFLLLATAAGAQTAGSPVTLDGRTLFAIRERVGSFTAEERARAVSSRIERLSRESSAEIDELQASDGGLTTDVAAGDLVVMTVTDADAKDEGKTRQALAEDYAKTIRGAIEADREAYGLKRIALGVAFTAAATVVLVLLLGLLRRFFGRLDGLVAAGRGTFIRSVKLKNLEILPADRIADFFGGSARVLRLALTVVAVYFYLTLVFSFFPMTRGFAQTLLHYLVSPLKLLAGAFLDSIPNLFFIAVIVVLTRSLLKVIQLVFEAMHDEKISWPGFYPEWSRPTYQIVRFLAVALALVVAFPYLPGSSSPAFKGVSVFLGVLLSLGSTSAVGNVVAGLVLTYMRPFKLGDRVKIADTTGDVTEKSLLVTRIHTIKNEDITIPNALILASHIVNFSTSARDEGLILHATVTIGYDAPWRLVHELLIAAAGATDGVLKSPAPFVYQTSLDDSYVSYQINAHTDRPNLMAKTYSDLNQNIQDKFNEGGVEIMSPSYSSVRDGSAVTLPPSYRPKGYKAPSFRVSRAEPGAD